MRGGLFGPFGRLGPLASRRARGGTFPELLRAHLFEENGNGFREDLPHVPVRNLMAHQGFQFLELGVEFAVGGESDRIALITERLRWPRAGSPGSTRGCGPTRRTRWLSERQRRETALLLERGFLNFGSCAALVDLSRGANR